MGIEDRDYYRVSTRKRRANERRRDFWNRVPWWLREHLRLAAVLLSAWALWKGLQYLD
jgi:hypothetical protein